MNWQKIRYLLWIFGFLFLALSALNFVCDVSQDAKGKTGVEQWVIGISDVLGASLVLAFWGWRWYKSRDYISESLPFPTKKVVYYVSLIVGLFLFLIIFVNTIRYFMKSAPEYLESQEFIKSNVVVTAKLGVISAMELDDTGSRFDENGGVRSGSYQFQVTGSSADGVMRIKWHDEDGKFVPTEIDEIVPPDNETVLWTKSGS